MKTWTLWRLRLFWRAIWEHFKKLRNFFAQRSSKCHRNQTYRRWDFVAFARRLLTELNGGATVKTKHKLISLVLALILVLAFAACGTANKMSSAEATYDLAAAPNAENGTSFISEQSQKDAGTAAGTDTTVGTADLPAADKIIYSGSATVETKDFDKTVEALAKMVNDCGGFVESSSVTGNDFYTEYSGGTTNRTAQYTFRIPVDKFKPFADNLSTLGNVPYSSSNAENITMQYTDTEARLTVYQTKETRLLELLAKANSMEDILAIENSLSDVQYQIESLTSQMENWDSLISFSSLSITVKEVSLYTEDNTSTLSYGEQLKEAFTRSIKGVGRFFKGFFKFLVGAFPVLVVLAVIAVPVLFIVRAAQKKKKAKMPPPTNPSSNDNPPSRQ